MKKPIKDLTTKLESILYMEPADTLGNMGQLKYAPRHYVRAFFFLLDLDLEIGLYELHKQLEYLFGEEEGRSLKLFSVFMYRVLLRANGSPIQNIIHTNS